MDDNPLIAEIQDKIQNDGGRALEFITFDKQQGILLL